MSAATRVVRSDAPGHALPAAATTAARAMPRWRAVLAEQLRRVGLSVRREAQLATGFLLLFGTLPVMLAHWRVPSHRSDLQFDELMLVAALLGVFAPLAVWKGEEPSRRAYFWTLPVGRSRHSLLRVLAGWMWTMAAVAAIVLWVVLLARATDGALSNGDAFVPLRPLAEDAAWHPRNYFHHPWPVPHWQWLVPFTGATAAYLVGSVVALASDHPWRWYAGSVLVFLLLVSADTRWSRTAADALLESRYGLETLLTGSEPAPVHVTTPEGHVVRHQVLQPLPARWAGATTLWIAVGGIGVVLAARRREG